VSDPAPVPSAAPPALPTVVVYTDGGAAPNPGPGAWAAVLQYGRHAWEISGAVPATTNNRMELQAAIQALKALNRPCAVSLHTDSNYVRQGITGWIRGWKRNGWKTSTKEPVKNRDLWMALDELAGRHHIEWHWLKGHAGHRWNERCDELATAAIERLRRETPASVLREALAALRESGQA
jgi:ribonuclease HI